MQTLKQLIREAEEVWLLPLLNHCNNLFSGVFLPSHDHLHHYRVWCNARELMLMMENAGCSVSPELPGKLILAAFFHDTGLINTHNEKHGMESRKLCQEFFRKANNPVPAGFHEILDAIEHHDDKSYHENSITGEPGPQVLIYRYAEIYLLRKVRPEDLPDRILENLNNRFQNLKNIFAPLKQFIDRQEIRYWITCEFYMGLSESYAAALERPDWKRELIRVFQDGLLRQDNLLRRERLLPDLEYDREILQFFMLLDEENSINTHT